MALRTTLRPSTPANAKTVSINAIDSGTWNCLNPVGRVSLNRITGRQAISDALRNVRTSDIPTYRQTNEYTPVIINAKNWIITTTRSWLTAFLDSSAGIEKSKRNKYAIRNDALSIRMSSAR